MFILQVSTVTFTFLRNIVCYTGTEERHAKLIPYSTYQYCLFGSTVNTENKNCVFGTHACLCTLSKNWLAFIAEPTASVPLVQKSSNGCDPELLLFTSHAYSLPSWFGAIMWFYQQVLVIGTFCRHV